MKCYDDGQDGGLEARRLPFTSIEDHNSSLRSTIVSVESLARSDASTLATILECHPSYKPSPNILTTPSSPPEAATSKWRPTSLGTGLVYDWEFSDGPYTDNTKPSTDKDLASQLLELTPKGFHPIHFHAYMQGQQARLASIWQKDDDSCYRYFATEALSKESVENLVENWKKITFSFRIVSIASIIPTDQSKSLYTISVIDDKQYRNTDWGVVLDVSGPQFLADITALKISAKRIISFTTTIDEHKLFALPRFSYIWTGPSYNPILPWKIETITLPASGQSITNKIKAQIAIGWVPVCMDSWYANGTGLLLVLYAEHQAEPNPELWWMYTNSTPDHFSSTHALSKAFYPSRQLVAYATYKPTPNGPLMAIGIWRNPLERFLDISEESKTSLPLDEAGKFEKSLTDFMKAADIPYAAMAVFKDGQIVLERAYRWGPRGLGPVDVNSLFRLASTAKVLTVLGVLKALEEKAKDELPLYNPGEVVSKAYLDYRAFVDFPKMPSITNHPLSNYLRKITVRNLLRHNSGFPTYLTNEGKPDGIQFPVKWIHETTLKHLGVKPPFPSLKREHLFDWVLDSTYWSDGPGDDHATDAAYKTGFRSADIDASVGRYSNVGYTFLEKLIEAITGQSYEDYVYNNILIPIGATSMRIIKDTRYFVDSSELLHSSQESYLGDNIKSSHNSIGPSLLGAWANSSLFPTDVYGGTVNSFGLIKGPYLGAGGWVGSVTDVIRIVGALRDFKFDATGSETKKGMVDLEGNTILEYDSVFAMLNDQPEVNVDGRVCLGWYATSDAEVGGTVELPVFNPRLSVKIRYGGGDFYGAHNRFAWRSDGKGWCFALSRKRGDVEEAAGEGDGDGIKVTQLFAEFTKLAKKL